MEHCVSLLLAPLQSGKFDGNIKDIEEKLQSLLLQTTTEGPEIRLTPYLRIFLKACTLQQHAVNNALNSHCSGSKLRLEDPPLCVAARTWQTVVNQCNKLREESPFPELGNYTALFTQAACAARSSDLHAIKTAFLPLIRMTSTIPDAAELQLVFFMTVALGSAMENIQTVRKSMELSRLRNQPQLMLSTLSLFHNDATNLTAAAEFFEAELGLVPSEMFVGLVAAVKHDSEALGVLPAAMSLSHCLASAIVSVTNYTTAARDASQIGALSHFIGLKRPQALEPLLNILQGQRGCVSHWAQQLAGSAASKKDGPQQEEERMLLHRADAVAAIAAGRWPIDEHHLAAMEQAMLPHLHPDLKLGVASHVDYFNKFTPEEKETAPLVRLQVGMKLMILLGHRRGNAMQEVADKWNDAKKVADHQRRVASQRHSAAERAKGAESAAPHSFCDLVWEPTQVPEDFERAAEDDRRNPAMHVRNPAMHVLQTMSSTLPKREELMPEDIAKRIAKIVDFVLCNSSKFIPSNEYIPLPNGDKHNDMEERMVKERIAIISCLLFFQDVATLFGRRTELPNNFIPKDQPFIPKFKDEPYETIAQDESKYQQILQILRRPEIMCFCHLLLLSASIALPESYTMMLGTPSAFTKNQDMYVDEMSESGEDMPPSEQTIGLHPSILTSVMALSCGDWTMFKKHGCPLMKMLQLHAYLKDGVIVNSDTVEALWLLVRGDSSLAALFHHGEPGRLLELLSAFQSTSEELARSSELDSKKSTEWDKATCSQLISLHNLATLDKAAFYIVFKQSGDEDHPRNDFSRMLEKSGMLMRTAKRDGASTYEVTMFTKPSGWEDGEWRWRWIDDGEGFLGEAMQVLWMLLLLATGSSDVFTRSTLEHLGMLLGVEAGYSVSSFTCFIQLADPYASLNLSQIQSMERLGFRPAIIVLFVRAMQGQSWALQELCTEIINNPLDTDKSTLAKMFRNRVQTLLKNADGFSIFSNGKIDQSKVSRTSKPLMISYLHTTVAAAYGDEVAAVMHPHNFRIQPWQEPKQNQQTMQNQCPAMRTLLQKWCIMRGYKALLECHEPAATYHFRNAAKFGAGLESHKIKSHKIPTEPPDFGLLMRAAVILKCQAGDAMQRLLGEGRNKEDLTTLLLGHTIHNEDVRRVQAATSAQIAELLLRTACGDTRSYLECFFYQSRNKNNDTGWVLPRQLALILATLIDPYRTAPALTSTDESDISGHPFADGMKAILSMRQKSTSNVASRRAKSPSKKSRPTTAAEPARLTPVAKKSRPTTAAEPAQRSEVLLMQAILRADSALHNPPADFSNDQYSLVQRLLENENRKPEHKEVIIELINLSCFGIGEVKALFKHISGADNKKTPEDLKRRERMLTTMLMAYKSPDHSILRRLLLLWMEHNVNAPPVAEKAGGERTNQLCDSAIRKLFSALLLKQSLAEKVKAASQEPKAKLPKPSPKDTTRSAHPAHWSEETAQPPKIPADDTIQLLCEMHAVALEMPSPTMLPTMLEKLSRQVAVIASQEAGPAPKSGGRHSDSVEIVMLRDILPKIMGVKNEASKSKADGPPNVELLQATRLWMCLMHFVLHFARKPKQGHASDTDDMVETLIQDVADSLTGMLGISKTSGDVGAFLQLLFALSTRNVMGALKVNALQHVAASQVQAVIKLLQATGSLNSLTQKVAAITRDTSRYGTESQSFEQMIQQLTGRIEGGELPISQLDKLMQQLDFDFIDEQRVEILSHVDDDKFGMVTTANALEPINRQAWNITIETLQAMGLSWGRRCWKLLFMGFVVILLMAFLFLGIRSFSTSSTFGSIVESILAVGVGVGSLIQSKSVVTDEEKIKKGDA
ncbi:hypothetical protein CYMTET_48051 [Cymbomonas tetramitiformis]|uniref:Uncharacterized protein n=1 Tax=Cymbomonas tetramitiformis TaxID=36881 RepID=A0AAE0EVD7_9CHLO|nr:hypothetical protein CYMTET_48051 [Cymbomonas tetramitiformis]